MDINTQLKEKYDNQYAAGIEEWRMLGGEDKATNIIEAAGSEEVANMVDVGSGEGSVLYWLDKHQFCKNITAVEISNSGIEEIKAKQLQSIKQVVKFDGYKLPFEDNTFDLAVCTHVIEHVEYPRMLIREIARVSKTQIFEIPIDFSFKVDQKVNHFLSYGHINIYTPQTFRFLLQSEGLEILNSKCSLYDKRVHAKLNENKSFLVKAKTSLKRILWNSIPALMNIKPNVVTVKTKMSTKALEIMT